MTDHIATRAAVKSVAIKRALKVVEKPMLFQDWGVRAILDGSKTQTRRVIKLREFGPSDFKGYDWDFRDRGARWNNVTTAQLLSRYCPHPVGSFIWVRETYRYIDTTETRWNGDEPVMIGYHADNSVWRFDGTNLECLPIDRASEWPRTKWRPSIFMPRWASRILLEVTDVRDQRVQDISKEDAKAEGVDPYVAGHGPVTRAEIACDPGFSNYADYRTGFSVAWEAINARRGHGWDVNDWVFAYTFRMVKP